MAKQRAPESLRAAVLSAGFTPSIRDVAGLVGLLDDSDDAVGRGAEKALVRVGASAAPRVLDALEGATTERRVRGLRVVGTLAPVEETVTRRVIAELLADDPRVQRAAANALGRLGGAEARDAIGTGLMAAWDRRPAPPLLRALAEAMGKLGVDEARERLQSATTQADDDELARIARNALAMLRREATRADASAIDGVREGHFDVELVFACRAGLEDLVVEEVRERCKGARGVRRGDAGEVRLTWRGALSELMTVRTMIGFAFELPPERLAGVAGAEAVDIACVRALTSERARAIVSTWTAGVVRYRIDWPGRGHQRGATWRLVHALRERAPDWINDPSESTWQISLRVDRGSVHVRLVPRRLDDRRFAYRVRDVPAASHPTVAAALVRVSRPRVDDVVWDPFVGSAVELVERAIAGPYERLIGSDLDAAALDAARGNVKAAGIGRVSLDLADARGLVLRGVTCVITNPPMGRRVARDGSLADLLDAFVDQVARVLVRGGRLAWLSPLGGQTARRAEENHLRVTLRQPVDMGGFHAELQLFEKP